MRKITIDGEDVYFIPFSQEQFYEDNDNDNIFSVDDDEYNVANAEELTEIYRKSI